MRDIARGHCLRIVLVLAALLYATPASPITLCTMPDGRKVASDTLPEGCKPQGVYENKPKWQPAAPDPGTTFSAPPFEVTEYKSIHDRYGNESISGVLHNGSGKALWFLSIQFALKDREGNILGHAIDNLVGGLPAGGTWRFEARIYPDNATSYALAGIKYH